MPNANTDAGYLSAFTLGVGLAVIFGWPLLFVQSPIADLRFPWFALLFGVSAGAIDALRVRHRQLEQRDRLWRLVAGVGGAALVQAIFLLQGPGLSFSVL